MCYLQAVVANAAVYRDSLLKEIAKADQSRSFGILAGSGDYESPCCVWDRGPALQNYTAFQEETDAWIFYMWYFLAFKCWQLILWLSSFQSFSSYGTQKTITKILWHTKKYSFCYSDKNRYNFDHSHQMPIIVLAIVIFYLTI